MVQWLNIEPINLDKIQPLKSTNLENLKMDRIRKLNKLLSYLAYKIFKPLVVLFLRNSITYQTSSDWLKRIYIDTAFENKEFRINPEKKQTKTRVAVLTGLSRVEIDRILKIDKPIEVTEQKWNRATKVLSAWCYDTDYLVNGKPALLPIYGEKSFSTLVEKYSGGATMRSVLDELVKVKSVQIKGGTARLVRQDYMEKPDAHKLINLEISGFSAGGLLDTLVFNDQETRYMNKRYQKIVFNRQIPLECVQEAKDYIYEHTDKLIFSIDDKLSFLERKHKNQPTQLMGIGAYYFEENNHEK